MIYTKNYQPRIGDYNRNGKLSLRSVLELLEDIGSCHSDAVKDSVIEGSQNGIAWILTEWNVEFARQPKPSEELTINTWVVGKAPASSVIREFEMTDTDGTPVIYAMARMVLVDMASGRLTRVSPELLASYSPEEAVKHEFSSERLRECKEYDREIAVTVRNADIDFNGHVHNTVYMDYAEEILQAQNISAFRIGYKTPVKSGEVLTVKAAKAEKETIGIYHADGTVATVVEVSYE